MRIHRLLRISFTLCLSVSIMDEASAMASADATGTIRCLFSDIDGTLVHYYENDAVAPGLPEVVSLPASATGRMGHISLETLKLAAKLRSTDARLVLVSGTRYSTFANRLPYLPRADAYVIENGGRIFYPKEAVPDVGDNGDEKTVPAASAVGDPSLTGHAASALEEDLEWRKRMEGVTGPSSQDDRAPDLRTGPLWDLYRRAVSEGFVVDTDTYYTMIRIKVVAGGSGSSSTRSGGQDEEEEEEGRGGQPKGGEKAMKRLLTSLPPGLRVVTNFGMVDICPEGSGKHNAAAYLAKVRFGIPLGRCASMGDDDNDIALADIMGKGAFITSFSSESVEAAAKGNPEQYRVAREEGVESSEELLRLILAGCSP